MSCSKTEVTDSTCEQFCKVRTLAILRSGSLDENISNSVIISKHKKKKLQFGMAYSIRSFSI